MSRVAVVVFFSLLTPLSVANDMIPYPPSWDFPEVSIAAHEITPENMAGIAFKEDGLAYSVETLATLSVLTMSARELQKYADVVTHAFPDAVAMRGESLEDCRDFPAEALNETSFGNIAYISLNAIKEENRSWAAQCLYDLQATFVVSEAMPE